MVKIWLFLSTAMIINSPHLSILCFLQKRSRSFTTLIKTPRANTFAERWVCSVREECRDHILILNDNHLRRVLKEYGEYYNYDRPHQGLGQHFPVSVTRPEWSKKGPIVRRDVLGASSTITIGDGG